MLANAITTALSFPQQRWPEFLRSCEFFTKLLSKWSCGFPSLIVGSPQGPVAEAVGARFAATKRSRNSLASVMVCRNGDISGRTLESAPGAEDAAGKPQPAT
jgi:hypothetical protein